MTDLIEVTEVSSWHCGVLARTMRAADQQEVWASSGKEPLEALRESVEASSHCWTGLKNKVPVAMFGVAPFMEGDSEIGIAWLLASDELYTFRKTAMFLSRVYVHAMQKHYEVLTNYIDYRNVVSEFWLRRLGFRCVGFIKEYGHEKRPFIQYARFRDVRTDNPSGD